MILFSVLGIYKVGFAAGVIQGAVTATKFYDKDFCVDFMNNTRDKNGACIIKSDSKYIQEVLDCGWEKFQLSGGKEKSSWVRKIEEKIARIIYYPLMRC